MLFYLVILFTGPVTYSIGISKYVFFILGSFISGILLIKSWMDSGTACGQAVPISILWLLMIGFQLLPLIWNEFSYDFFLETGIRGASLALFLFSASSLASVMEIQTLFKNFAVMLFILSLLGVIERLGVFDFGYSSSPVRIRTTLEQANVFGGVMAALMPPGLLWLFFKIYSKNRNSKGRIYLFAGFSILFLIITSFSLSYSTVLAVGVEIIIALIFFPFLVNKEKSQQRWFKVKLAGIAAGLFIMIFALGTYFLYKRGDYLSGGISNFFISRFSTRIPFWQTALNIWQKDSSLSIIFGSGPGAFFSYNYSCYPPDFRLIFNGRGARHAHNEFLELLAEGGLISLGLWIFILIILCFSLIRVVREEKAELFIRKAAIVVFCSLIGIQIQAFFSVAVRTASIQMLTGIFAGLAVFLYKEAGFSPFKSGFSGILQKVPVIMIITALLGGISIRMIPYTISEIFTKQCIVIDGKTGGEVLDEELLTKAFRYNPQNIFALYNQMVFLAERKPDQALDAGESILKLIPGYRNTYRIIGNIYADRGDFGKAEYYLEKQVRLDRMEVNASLEYISALIMNNLQEEAVAATEDFLQWREQFFRANYKIFFYDVNKVPPEEEAPYRPDRQEIEGVIGFLSDSKEHGYRPVYVNLALRIGRLFQIHGSSDRELVYYNAAAMTGILPVPNVMGIIERNMVFFEKSLDSADSVYQESLLKKYEENIRQLRQSAGLPAGEPVQQ